MTAERFDDQDDADTASDSGREDDLEYDPEWLFPGLPGSNAVAIPNSDGPGSLGCSQELSPLEVRFYEPLCTVAPPVETMPFDSQVHKNKQQTQVSSHLP